MSSFIIFDTVKKNNKTKQKKKKARCSIEYNYKASKLKLILSHLDKYTYTTFPHLYFVYNDGFGFLFNLSWFRLVWFFFFFSLDTLKSITHAHHKRGKWQSRLKYRQTNLEFSISVVCVSMRDRIVIFSHFHFAYMQMFFFPVEYFLRRQRKMNPSTHYC